MTKNDYRVCVVGLGPMGIGPARSCIAAGLTTYGTDLTPSVCQALKEAGAAACGPDATAFAA